MENLQIQTVKVEIKVILVGGKKMTKAVFNQIQEERIYPEDLENEDNIILGYVKYTGYNGMIVWVSNGELRKMCMHTIHRISEVFEHYNYFYGTSEVEKLLNSFGFEYYEEDKNKNHEQFILLNNHALKIYDAIKGNQIYIAT